VKGLPRLFHALLGKAAHFAGDFEASCLLGHIRLLAMAPERWPDRTTASALSR
jgi:hypothetical protein